MENQNYIEQNEKHRKIVKKVAQVTLAANLVLMAIKMVFGVLFQNMAVISDAVHTLSDAALTLLVLLAAVVSTPNADKDHNYGHEKREPLLVLLFALALGGIGIWLFIEGIIGFLNPQDVTMDIRTYVLIGVTALSVLGKEAMYRYTTHYAKIIKSEILKADAWHHRADSLSALAVLIGLGSGIFLQKDWLENAAVVLVAALIIAVAIRIFKTSVGKLTDKAADDKTRAGLLGLIAAVEGVKRVEKLQTRLFGDGIFADVEIGVDAGLSVLESHEIAEAVRDALEGAPEYGVKRCNVLVNPVNPVV